VTIEVSVIREMLDPASSSHEAFRADPFPVWESLRHDHPIWYNETTKTWILTRYRDVVAAFGDSEAYSNSIYEASLGRVFGPTLLQMDGRDHVVRRTMIAPQMMGKRLEGYRSMIENAATLLIDQFRGEQVVDLVSVFSTWLPVNVICRMLGLPTQDMAQFHSWYQTIMVGFAGNSAQRREAFAAVRSFSDYCLPIIMERRIEPGEDFISRIIHTEADGQKLTDAEVCSFLSAILVAGGETTDGAISGMWSNLLANPEQRAAVAANPERFDDAFGETMRHSFPVTHQVRLTTCEVAWHDTLIPAGSTVQLTIGSANYDETIFADPARFDLERSDLWKAKELRSGHAQNDVFGHLAFGLGKHFCPGYELARLEAIVGSQLLLEAFPKIRLVDGADLRQTISGQTRSLRKLPVLL
jgi:cytochrome P450